MIAILLLYFFSFFFDVHNFNAKYNKSMNARRDRRVGWFQSVAGRARVISIVRRLRVNRGIAQENRDRKHK